MSRHVSQSLTTENLILPNGNTSSCNNVLVLPSHTARKTKSNNSSWKMLLARRRSVHKGKFFGAATLPGDWVCRLPSRRSPVRIWLLPLRRPSDRALSLRVGKYSGNEETELMAYSNCTSEVQSVHYVGSRKSKPRADFATPLCGRRLVFLIRRGDQEQF